MHSVEAIADDMLSTTSFIYNRNKSMPDNINELATKYIQLTTAKYRKSISPMAVNTHKLIKYLDVIHNDEKSPLYIAIEERLLLRNIDNLI